MPETNLAAVLGRKGQGKTTLLKAIVEAHRKERRNTYFMVLDSTREWTPKPRLEILDSLNWSANRAALRAIEHKNRVTLVIPEVDKYAPKTGLAPGEPLTLIVNEGRHLGVALLCDARRTARVHNDIGYLADTLFMFRHTGPNDLDWIARVCGPEWAHAVRNLPDHAFVRYEL